jgi:hypothetical protein
MFERMVVDAYPTYGLVGVTNYSLSDHRSGFRMHYVSAATRITIAQRK